MNTIYYKTDKQIVSVTIKGKEINVQNGLIQAGSEYESCLKYHGFYPYNFVNEIKEEEVKPKSSKVKKHG